MNHSDLKPGAYIEFPLELEGGGTDTCVLQVQSDLTDRDHHGITRGHRWILSICTKPPAGKKWDYLRSVVLSDETLVRRGTLVT